MAFAILLKNKALEVRASDFLSKCIQHQMQHHFSKTYVVQLPGPCLERVAFDRIIEVLHHLSIGIIAPFIAPWGYIVPSSKNEANLASSMFEDST
jgi:peptide deformylase